MVEKVSIDIFLKLRKLIFMSLKMINILNLYLLNALLMHFAILS